MNRRELARYIDHTLLRPDATVDEVHALVDQAMEWGCLAVCVNSGYVNQAAAFRGRQSALRIAATVGFPLGQANTAGKVAEARAAVEQGADEIDMVWNLGLFLTGDTAAVERDIHAVVDAVGNIPVKVILETARLTPDQMRRGAEAAVRAGAHTVKTSSGFGFSGATREAVEVLRETVGPTIGVKASGGIRRYHHAVDLIAAGATRLGLSQTGSILAEAPK